MDFDMSEKIFNFLQTKGLWHMKLLWTRLKSHTIVPEMTSLIMKEKLF